jgi:nitroimidazol reductase NimA-like FMN-containing flavoprotein (pyridoxamine 5'-phosphate oxidase superfamily)
VVPGGSGEERDLLNDELVQELLARRLIANLATVNSDGSAHVVGMWFLWENGRLLLPTNGSTRKARNLERDPRATVMIDDSRGGLDLRGVTLVCSAEIRRGDNARTVNRRIHLKYLTGRGRELPAVDDYLSTDDVTLELEPIRFSSWDLRGTAAGRALGDSGEFRPLD